MISFVSLLKYYKPSNVSIRIANNNLLKAEIIDKYVFSYLQSNNIILLSPRVLSKQIIKDFPVTENVIIRKYLFPKPVIYISLIEKKIWSVIYPFDNSKISKIMFISTTDGDLLKITNLSVEKDLAQLIKIYASDINALNNNHLLNTKKFLDSLDNKIKKLIDCIQVYEDLEMTVVLKNGSKIFVGYVDNDLFKQKVKFDAAIKLAIEKSINPEYVDLTLENHVVIKPKTEETKAKTGIFKKIFNKSKTKD